MRSVSADSPIFNPYSYAAGSVSPLNSTSAALAFCKAHRPDTAVSLWSGILPWNTLDSFGHLHEVLAGNFYHPQLESVPEQTWSSAGLLDSIVRGLLGLNINGEQNQLVFAPHLLPQWTDVSVENIAMPHAKLSFTLHQALESLDLEIHNNGEPVPLMYEPHLPLGARLIEADEDGHRIKAEIRHFPEEDQAHLEMEVPTGSSHCHLRFTGGVSIILNQHLLQIGDTSTEMKITHLNWSGNVLHIDADFSSFAKTAFQLKTPLKVTNVKGAAIRSLSDGLYELTVQPAQSNLDYKPSEVAVTFANP